MEKINFLNQYYKTRTSDQNPSDLVNMYIEEDKDQGKYQAIAYPTPGLTAFNSGSGSVVRGMLEHRGVLYAVVDNTFYSYNSSGVRTSLGTLLTSTGIVDIDDITSQIMIVDGTYGYNFNSNTNTFAQVTDPDFLAIVNPTTMVGSDEYFLVSALNSSQIYGSDAGDGTSWNALSFSSKEGSADYITKLSKNKRMVWVIGQYTSEIWQNSGAATFSFDPYPNALIEYGSPARRSVARGANDLFMLAQSKTGGLTVIQFTDFTPNVISNRAIAYQLSQLTTVNDAIGYCYRQSGHEFYVLTFPTEGKTWAYDTTTGLWHEKQSYVSGSYTRHIANCSTFCYNKRLVGDYASGKLFYYDESAFLENSQQMLRRIVTPAGYDRGNKVYVNRIQIDLETGIGSTPTVTLEVSKDGGHSYSNTLTGTIPTAGNRLYWARLGMTQNSFVFRFTCTANAKFVVLGALAEYESGIN